MIIKYYYKGWNIIDEVKNVKIIRKLTGEVLSRANKNEVYKPSDGETKETIVYNKLCAQTLKEVEEMLETMAHCTMFAFESEFVNRNMFEEYGEYYTVLVYNEGNQLKCLMFNTKGFILNNEGKTIEKI